MKQSRKQIQTHGHTNRCERCNRKLKDQSARLGWRCAEILGAEQSLNHAGDEAFRNFSRGVSEAGKYIRNNRININRINLPKFYESYIKQHLVAGIEDHSLWTKARSDMREALNPRYDRNGRIRLQPSQAPDIARVLDMRDRSDYQKGKYSTTAFTDNKYNHHAQDLQKNLNKLGFKDKFGNTLKEDGILGPKTQWVVDTSPLFSDIGKGITLSGGITQIESDSERNGYRNISNFPEQKRRGSKIITDISRNSAYQLPYVQRILSGNLQPGNIFEGRESDYDAIQSYSGNYLRDGSPVSKKEKDLYSEAFTKALLNNYIAEGARDRIDEDLYKNNGWYKTHADYISKIQPIDIELNDKLDEIKKVYNENYYIYQEIAAKSNIPPELVAAMHYRENASDFLNGMFDVYFHNGQELGFLTTIVPKNKYFDKGQFVEAAIDALKGEYNNETEKFYLEVRKNQLNLSLNSKDIVAMVAFATYFNGMGGSLNGKTSYGYNGTSIYEGGLFTSDGHYDPNASDQNLGVYVILDRLL